VFYLILLEIQCPRCKRNRKWLSYTIKKREEVMGKKARCFNCEYMFTIKGASVDRIIKEIRYDGD